MTRRSVVFVVLLMNKVKSLISTTFFAVCLFIVVFASFCASCMFYVFFHLYQLFHYYLPTMSDYVFDVLVFWLLSQHHAMRGLRRLDFQGFCDGFIRFAAFIYSTVILFAVCTASLFLAHCAGHVLMMFTASWAHRLLCYVRAKKRADVGYLSVVNGYKWRGEM